MNYCDDCGCKVFNGACVNCHEEIYIQEQYEDLEMEVPKLIRDKNLEHEPKIIKNLELEERLKKQS